MQISRVFGAYSFGGSMDKQKNLGDRVIPIERGKAIKQAHSDVEEAEPPTTDAVLRRLLRSLEMMVEMIRDISAKH